MKVRCIDVERAEGYLKYGEVYEVSDDFSSGSGSMHYIVVHHNPSASGNYFKGRFEIVNDTLLPDGSKLCSCGTITTNKDKCCECRAK